MCWTGPYSAAFAAAGFTGAAWARKKGHEPFRWMPLAYFSVMETLQAFTYIYVGECGHPANKTLTILSYLHICFQPFFVNMFAMSWIKPERRKLLNLKWVWGICAFATSVMLLMLLFKGRWSECEVGKQMLCGEVICSYRGEWHIAWKLPLTNLDGYYLVYWISAFLVPILYRSWRFVLYHFLLGPVFAWSMTGDINERAAIWCLASIGFLLATHIPFIAKWMAVPPKKKKAEPALE